SAIHLCWFCSVTLGGLSLLSLLSSMLGCMDAQGVLAQNGTIPPIQTVLEKLLERAVQHAELIYRVSEESKLLFCNMLISYGMNLHIPKGTMCAPKMVPVPMSKSEIQQISDKWILHSLLILAQFWIDPLVEVQASLENYENAPSALLTRSKWISTKLMSLEQGIMVLIRQTSDRFVSSNILQTVRRDYSVIYCFRKDAHKMQTFLKLLKCRQIDKENCSLF
uniref:Somatolactin-like n=1 Tax=Sinocyclocheilus anshuiensis TaxID=1608454 RepID=A0A671T980_9TELE